MSCSVFAIFTIRNITIKNESIKKAPMKKEMNEVLLNLSKIKFSKHKAMDVVNITTVPTYNAY